MSGTTPKRDPRIDLLRGMALIVVFVNHIPGNCLSILTPSRWGLSDMAEVFVFFSGYVCGLTYGRELTTHGFIACQRKACGRVLELYLANVTVMTCVLVVLQSFAIAPPGYMSPHVVTVDSLHADLSSAIPGVLLLSVQTNHFAILPLYIILISVLPLVLAGLCVQPWLVLLASLTIYLCVQVWPEHLVIPSPWQDAWFFNPLAWQFLFYAGSAVSFLQWDRHLPHFGRAGAVAAAIVLNAVFLWRMLDPQHAAVWSAKATLAPLRVAHFAILMCVARELVSINAHWLSSNWVKPLQWAGQRSLWTYCLGGLLAISATFLMPAVSHTCASHGAMNVFCCVLLCFSAKGFDLAVRSGGMNGHSNK